jgi:excinuclease ABC subunit C
MRSLSLHEKIKTLPEQPGCYLMKNASGTIIYVGKAKRLKQRVSQYFTGAHNYKTTKLVQAIEDFDTIVTRTEKEALILEINLIKKHRPHYNIMFMDDKSYPYIKITADRYARLTIARDFRKKDKGARYFGPYPNAQAARTMVNLLNLMYPLRKCTTLPKKVCLYYHLGQCLGPCEFDVSVLDYQELLKEVIAILNGDVKRLRQKLQVEMDSATEALAFEKAKEFRDYLIALEHVMEQQRVSEDNSIDRDYFNVYEADGYISLAVLMVRGGQLIDRHLATQLLVDDPSETLTQFMVQYYEHHQVPKEIYVPVGIDVDLLSDSLGAPCHQPQRGGRKALLDLALTNAQTHHNQHVETIKRASDAQNSALNALKDLLGLKSIDVIELVDNSHTGGSYASSAVVVFKQGQPSKKDYRLYNVKHGADDLKNMQEVMYRRYLRVLKENLPLPQVLLVDGGFQQLKHAHEVLSQLGFEVPMYGLVKDDKHQSAALIKLSGERIELKTHPEVYFVLARMQDEVHRFVLRHHQKRRSKGLTASLLDEVEGMGPKRKRILLRHFKSIEAIKNSSDEALAAFIPMSVVRNLKAHLNDDEGVV